MKRRKPYNNIDHWLAQVAAQGFPARTVADIDRAILTLYRRKRSIREVALALKVSFNGIGRHLRRLGIPRRPRGGPNNPAGGRWRSSHSTNNTKVKKSIREIREIR